MGRKRIDNDKKKVNFSISLSNENINFLKSIADREGVPLSNLIERLVEDFKEKDSE